MRAPQESLALRQVTDPVDGFRRHAGVHELRQAAGGGDDPQRGVLRTGELTGGVHDPPQDVRQGEVPDDQLVGMQEATKPALRGDDLRRALDQLSEQLVQLQPWKIRKGQRLPRQFRPGSLSREPHRSDPAGRVIAHLGPPARCDAL